MNTAGQPVAGRHGLTLGYHDHSSEIHALKGVPVYQRCIKYRLDPAIVFHGVDIVWVVVGGADPLDGVVDDLGDHVVSLPASRTG